MLAEVKNILFHIIRTWFGWFSVDVAVSLPQGPALIIAPHPDDETIGCGGMITRFCMQGRNVHVVIVTDGSSSTQSDVITPEKLAAIRRQESLSALKVLGLSHENVFFLGYQDNQISHNILAISQAIAEHIAQLSPALIFTPHDFDEHPDHRVMASIIGELQDREGISARILQYPVWYKTLSWPYGMLRCLLTPAVYRCCRMLELGSLHATKAEALLQYRSQFENLTGEASWSFFSAASRKRFGDTMELFFEWGLK